LRVSEGTWQARRRAYKPAWFRTQPLVRVTVGRARFLKLKTIAIFVCQKYANKSPFELFGIKMNSLKQRNVESDNKFCTIICFVD